MAADSSDPPRRSRGTAWRRRQQHLRAQDRHLRRSLRLAAATATHHTGAAARASSGAAVPARAPQSSPPDEGRNKGFAESPLLASPCTPPAGGPQQLSGIFAASFDARLTTSQQDCEQLGARIAVLSGESCDTLARLDRLEGSLTAHVRGQQQRTDTALARCAELESENSRLKAALQTLADAVAQVQDRSASLDSFVQATGSSNNRLSNEFAQLKERFDDVDIADVFKQLKRHDKTFVDYSQTCARDVAQLARRADALEAQLVTHDSRMDRHSSELSCFAQLQCSLVEVNQSLDQQRADTARSQKLSGTCVLDLALLVRRTDLLESDLRSGFPSYDVFDKLRDEVAAQRVRFSRLQEHLADSTAEVFAV